MHLPEIPGFWWLVLASLALTVITSVIMKRQEKHFCYRRGFAITYFSIMDLEFPGSPASIAHIIRGIESLPDPTMRRKSAKALERNLAWDFVFMFGIYPLIGLLCYRCAMLISGDVGRIFFLVLSFAQILALLLDFLENVYLLRQLKSRAVTAEKPHIHKRYVNMVKAKWAIAATGGIASLSALLYFWIIGGF